MKLGNIADGDDFFDRETELADLWRYLADDHIVASGPRRLGKSSIVNQLCKNASGLGFLAKHVDVQGIESAEDFIEEVSRHFPEASISGYLKALSKPAKDWLKRINKIEGKAFGGGGAIELAPAKTQKWTKSANALQARLFAAPVIICIDEFSVFLQKLLAQNPQEAEALLAWLRAWRVKSGCVCRFLFTGSIGLNGLLENHRMTAQFNDCYEYAIGPFRPIVAKKMVIEFAKRAEWHIDPATAKHLCDRVGWLSPYYVCLMLDQTMLAGRDRREETDPMSRQLLEIADVNDAYERLLGARSRFVHWEQRLDRDLTGKELAICKVVLTVLAKQAEGLSQRQLLSRLAKLEANPDSRKERLQKILCKLQEDGYISAPDDLGHVQFLSFLLRDFWKRNHP